MAFVKTENYCEMAVKWILDNKKGRRIETPPETKRSDNTRKIEKE